MLPRVSIVMPVFGRAELTHACLESLAATVPDDWPYELIVVDNASPDGTADLLRCLEGDVTVVTNRENLGFGRACNQGAERARGELVLFLNNDTVLLPGWLDPLVAALDDDPLVAAVQPKLLYPDGRLNDAGGLVFAGGDAWVYGKRHPFPDAPAFSCRRAPDYASGACLLVRRHAFAEVGGFDDRYAPAYYEDTDLSFALRAAGWKVLYEPASAIVHVEGGTAGADLGSGLKAYQVRNRERFAARWADELATRPPLDPAIVEAWAHRPQGGFGPGEDPAPALAGDRLSWDTARAAAAGARSVLVVDPFLIAPDRSSGHLRLWELLRALRADGHVVAYYASHVPPGRREAAAALLGSIGVPCYGLDPASTPPEARIGAAYLATYEPPLTDLVRQRRFTAAVLEFYETAERFSAQLRQVSPGTVQVLDTVDVHFVREGREAAVRSGRVTVGRRRAGDAGEAGAHGRAVETRRRELAACRAVDAVVCVTDADAAALGAALPSAPVVLVPNAHAERDPGPGFDGRHGLVFVGNFLHPPNLDAVVWWRHEIAPRLAELRPGLSLTVVGNDPRGAAASLAGPGLQVVGWVPDTLPLLHRARVSVAPLRYGAGMKGKVGEALSAGLPLVATSMAAEGMALEPDVHALLADDADAFAEAVARLHDDAQLWGRLRDEGRRHVHDRFGLAAMRRAAGAVAALAPPWSPGGGSLVEAGAGAGVAE